MNYDSAESAEETPSIPDRSRQSLGPEGRNYLPTDEEDAPPAGPSPLGQSDPPDGIDPDELRRNPLLLAQVTAHLQENHLHLPLFTPDIEVMAKMKKETPELYDAYVKAIRSQTRADEVARTSPYTEPGRVALRGQVSGLIAVIAVLILAGYLAYLGHPVAGSIIAGIDVVALAAVFAGGRQGPSDSNGSSKRGD